MNNSKLVHMLKSSDGGMFLADVHGMHFNRCGAALRYRDFGWHVVYSKGISD